MIIRFTAVVKLYEQRTRYTSVGFAKDVEVVGLILRKKFEPLGQHIVEITGHFILEIFYGF